MLFCSVSLLSVSILRRARFVLSGLAAVTVATGWLAGCSSSEEAQENAGSSSVLSVTPAEPASSPVTTGASSTTSVAAPPPKLVAAALILTTDQLGGGGWRVTDDADPEGGEVGSPQPASPPECSGQSWVLRTGAIDTAGAAWYFAGAAETESVTSQAFVYQDEQSATAALASYRAVVERCGSWRSGADAADLNFQMQQEVFEVPIGTESVARKETAVLIGFPDLPPGTVYWVTSRVGSAIVQVTFQGGTLLGDAGGRDRATALAEAAVANASR